MSLIVGFSFSKSCGESTSRSTTFIFHTAVHEVKRDKLQLVGVTAMLIASKFEEIYAPEVRDFVYITDNVCS